MLKFPLKIQLALILIFLTLGFFLLFKRGQIMGLNAKKPVETGATEILVQKAESGKKKSWCDDSLALQRLAVARAVDFFRPDLDRLWRNRKPPEVENKQGMIRVGPLEFLPKTERKLASEIDSTDWNWSDTYHKLRSTQTQTDASERLWLEVDTAAQYLAKRDADRTNGIGEFLPPKETKHIFRLNQENVQRLNKNTLKITLDAGDFENSKEELKKIIEDEWKFKNYRLQIEWATGNAQYYRFTASKSSGKSFVDHRSKLIQISAYAPVRTLAHEVGHVLGFSDHYYDVWHDRNCYYTQEFRASDLMSDSANGSVHQEHWTVLNEAYPLHPRRKEARFLYTYGNLVPNPQ